MGRALKEAVIMFHTLSLLIPRYPLRAIPLESNLYLC